LPEGASPRVINCDFDLGSVFQRPGKESAFTYDNFFDLTPNAVESVGTGAPWSAGSVTLNAPTPGTCPLIAYFPNGPATPSFLGNVTTDVIGPNTNEMKVNDVIFFLVQTGQLFHPDTACIGITDSLGTLFTELGSRLVAFGGENLQVFYGPLTAGLAIGGTYTFHVTYNHQVIEVEQVVLGKVIRGILPTISQINEGVFTEPGPPPTPYGGPPITTTDTEFVMSFLLSPRNAQVDPDYTNINTTPGITGTYIAAHYVSPDISDFHSPAGTYTGNFHGVAGGGTTQVAVKNVSFPLRPCCGPVQVLNPVISVSGDISGTNLITLHCQNFPTDGPGVMLLPSVIGVLFNVYSPVTSVTDSLGNTWTAVQPPTSYQFSTNSPGDFTSYSVYGVALPDGIPAGYQIFMHFDDVGYTAGFQPNQIMYLKHGVSIDQAAFALPVGPGLGGGFVSGASITTSQPEVIVSIAGVIDQFGGHYSVPAGSSQYHNDGGFPGLGSAIYGGLPFPTSQPAGTYNPSWGTAEESLTQIPMSTISIVPCSSGGSPGLPTSQILENLNFGPPIPPNEGHTTNCGCGCLADGDLPLFGLEVLITGSQTDLSPDAVLTVQLQLPDGTLSPTIFTIQLPSSPGTVVVGSPTELWGLPLTVALINDPNFQVNIVASTTGGELVTFTATVVLRAFTPPNPPPDINYLKTFAQIDGDLYSLMLGSNGVMYQEDVNNNPNVLTPVYTAIEPNTFAESATIDDREFIALSNLLNGTDIPYTYDGQNFDRLSQVGPGAPPTASTSTATIDIVSITQPTAKSDPEQPGQLSGILWSNGPGSTAPGNVLTVYYARVSAQPLADPDLQPGVGVELAGIDVPGPNNNFNGQSVDGDYLVVSIGQGVPPGAQFERWYFTVTMPSTQSVNQADHEEGHGPFGTYQVTTATLTTSAQVPNLEVGNSIGISGTGGAPPAGYDGTWPIQKTPNAAQLQITSTSLTGNIATFGFNVITGTTPAVGQTVTVSGTLNGNGIFNIVNLPITSTSPGVFSVNLTNPDIPSSSENGAGVIFGTIFVFDPLKVVGNRTGGSLVTIGIISAGIRKVCYSFLTRNGYMTAPSPILTFDVPSGASTLTIGNLASGPDDVVARVVHLTAANGGNFYNIPIDVIVISNGLPVTNTSTYLKDNTSRSINLSFSDGVLLAATSIDTQGNNLFATLELGSSLGIIEYASRAFAIGEQNKVPNFLNWSFDGGYLEVPPAAPGIPLGWTPTAGGTLVNSPLFGFAYQIANATGSTQATYGMITQPAFVDEFLVPIINASTKYSVRITAAVAAATTGNLVVDLYSPSSGLALGTFSVPLASLGTTMDIFTGTLLTTVLKPVPKDLILRAYAATILNGAAVTIDRVEVFPTEQPVLSTQITGSYVNNFEAFDESGEGGIVDTAGENQQPVRSAFVMFDTLYIVKSGSLLSTQDNSLTEPSGWSIRNVSASVGTPSLYGVTTGIDEPNTGEAWAIIAGQGGGYIFNGGQPVKITEEIQLLWNLINWRYGHTLWVKNDVKNRRILFGVPLKTPNQWLPTGIIPDDQNPTTPNVILMCNYRQLNTGEQLESKVGVHVSYAGRLIASEQTRKWSIWTIKAPAAAFLRRPDNTDELFLGNSDENGKVFELVDGLAQDDCSAMTQIYITYGFVTDDGGQALKIGSMRNVYTYAVTRVDGAGNLNLRTYPNDLLSPFAQDLLPRLTLPMMAAGDIEVPLNETANRLFFEYKTDEIGANFDLSRLLVITQEDPWSPVRGVNY
jgi:hypothetical protein